MRYARAVYVFVLVCVLSTQLACAEEEKNLNYYWHNFEKWAKDKFSSVKQWVEGSSANDSSSTTTTTKSPGDTTTTLPEPTTVTPQLRGEGNNNHPEDTPTLPYSHSTYQDAYSSPSIPPMGWSSSQAPSGDMPHDNILRDQLLSLSERLSAMAMDIQRAVHASNQRRLQYQPPYYF